MKKVFAFLADGFEEIEAVSTIDVLRRADIEVITVSITGRREVQGAHGIPLVADALFDDLSFSDADMLFLPGGMPGTKHLGEHEALQALLKKHAASGKYIAAICAAPTVLAKNDLLDGKQAICYPGFEAELSKACISDAAVVRDANFITGKGPGVSIRFALEMVEVLRGETVRRSVSEALCFRA